MKKSILIFLALSLILTFSSCKKGETQKDNEGGFATDLGIEKIDTQDDNLNFTIDGLEKWAVFSVTRNGYPERTYYSPNDENGNTTNANISVTAIEPDNESLGTFSEKFYDSIKNSVSEFEVIAELTPSKLSVYDALYCAYSYSAMGIQKIIIEQTFALVEGKIYMITCTSPESSYENYREIFGKAIENFKFS